MAILIFLIEIGATVAGQLLLKKAMARSTSSSFREPRVLVVFVAGIASLTISFFLTIALLQHFDLSFFYPIQGSTVLIVTIAAVVVLRERLSARLLIGSVLITAGIVVVSLS